MRNVFTFSRYHEYILVFSLLTILVIQLFNSLERINLTPDETPHLGAGYSYWETRDFRLNREHPPLAKLVGAAPLMFKDLSTQQSWPYFLSAPEWDTTTASQFDFSAALLLSDNREVLESILHAARRSVSVFALILAVGVYLFSKQLFGIRGGLVSLLALVFNPDILAHGRLITTDMAMSTFYFTTVACLWWYFQRPSPKKLIGVGILLGLGLASKYSNLLLVPVLACLVFAAWFHESPCHSRPLAWFNPFGAGSAVKRGTCLLTASLAVMAAAALMLWASYLFTDPFSQYWAGYRQINKNFNTGFEFFLLGEYSAHRFWNYFLVTTALKTPLPVFFLLLLAFAAYWVHWRQKLAPITKWVLILPPLILFIAMSLKALNIGHRYVLGIYPYLFVLLGMTSYWLRDIHKQSLRCCSLLTLSTVLGVLTMVRSGLGAYPFYLSYHNALVRSDLDFINYLDDSNNDWGQAWKELARLQKEEKLPPFFVYQQFNRTGDEAGIRGNWLGQAVTAENPAPGIHALSATVYRRTRNWFQKHQAFSPLLQQYEPARMVAGAIVLIEVPYPSLVEQTHSLFTERELGPNGQLLSIRHYYLNENGEAVLSGPFQTWNEKNELTQRAHYIDGQLSGPYTLWQGGKLAESGYMWNGKIHGTVYRWDDSGNLTNTFHYLEGRLLADR